jgi:NCAIR mutase (PurE)-related protein
MNPFEHLRRELNGTEVRGNDSDVRADSQRSLRTGTPEVVLAAGKTIDQIATAINSLLPATGRVIVSRIAQSTLDEIRSRLGDTADVTATLGKRACLVALPGRSRPSTGGRVAVITAGTSDVAVASEAALMAEEMGCDVRTAWDAGVAGIHRLVQPLESLTEWDADVFVVAAGMDGVLPTVVSGLVSQPVIGLPVSTGYGFGGEGLGALTTMLQSCAPGLAIVNIDNGIGAGAMAALIANRTAHFRQAPPAAAP